MPEFTRERDERLRILVNSCIREVDRIGVRGRGESCAEILWLESCVVMEISSHGRAGQDTQQQWVQDR